MASADPIYLEENIESIPQVENIVRDIATRYDLSEDLHGNMLVSVTEAVNNAITHGNQNDKSKCVQMHITKGDTLISVHITDEGNGFDHDDLPDPTAPENLLNDNGRGVFIIQQLCDEVVYLNEGRTVKMCFHLCQQ